MPAKQAKNSHLRGHCIAVVFVRKALQRNDLREFFSIWHAGCVIPGRRFRQMQKREPKKRFTHPMEYAMSTSIAAGIPTVAQMRALVLEQVKSGKLSIEQAGEQLAKLTSSAKTRQNGDARPLYRRDGALHGQKDARPYRLCRRDEGKVDMINFQICAAPKGCGYAGSLNVAIPTLRALVDTHGENGMFANALSDYDSKSICLSRETD
jgi:hypothetical protein